MRRTSAVIAVLALLLAACSSTSSGAKKRSGKSGLATTGDATTETTLAAAGGTDAAAGDGSSAGAGGGTTNRRSGSTETTAPNSPAGAVFKAATALVPSSHKGVTPTEVRVGVTYAADGAAVATAFGLKGVNGLSTAQAEKLFRGIESRINATGGVAGRKLKIVIEPVNVLTGTFDSQAQAVCERFTNDTPVFAVVPYANVGSDVLPTCLANHDSVHIEHGNSQFRDRKMITGTLKSAFYEPHRIELDRFDMVIDNLFAQGYFDKGAKVGLVRFDAADYERTEKNVIKPALARHGLALADTFAFKKPGSTAAISQTANEANSAVLRFRSKGITHVIFELTLTALPFLFMPAAESQGYHPRYGITSGDLPDFLTQNVPAAQLDRAAVVGWSRVADKGERQGFDDSESMKTCKKIAAAADMPTPEMGYGVACDPFLFLQAALNKAPRVSVGGFRAGADAIGSALSLSDLYGTLWGPGRVSGPGAVRSMVFDRGCTCFKYSSGPKPAQ